MPLTALLSRVTVIVSLLGKLLIVKQPLTGVLILVDVVRSVAVGAGLSGKTVIMMFWEVILKLFNLVLRSHQQVIPMMMVVEVMD